jgi:hypothetical protein
MGDAASGAIQLSFNPQLRVEFRGATVTSDAGLLLAREMDEHLGLGALIARHLTDPRRGRNRQFPLVDLFRQSIYSRLAGYEDTNDAERLAEDPTFRMLASRERRETSVALTSTLHWFETDVLPEEQNYEGLGHLNTALIEHAATRSPRRRVILDIDSSESPVHGAQEQSAYNGHFESVCYHPLFVFNPEGDCLAAKLRPGNVHSADGWDDVLLPLIDRYRVQGQTVVVRADAAFALPALYEALERRGVRYAIRLPANQVLERRIEDLLTRPRGRPSHAPLVRYRSFEYQAASWDRPRRVIAKIEHHLGELFPRVGFIVTTVTGTNRAVVRFYNQQPTRDGGAVDQGGQSRDALDAPLLSPLPGEPGPVAPRGHRLQPRQSAPSACSARRHPDLVPHESPAAAVQDGRAADPTCPVLHAAACRKLLDGNPLPANSRAHRATRMVPDVIESDGRAGSRVGSGGGVATDGDQLSEEARSGRKRAAHLLTSGQHGGEVCHVARPPG